MFSLTTHFSNLLIYLACCIVICKPHDFTLHQKLYVGARKMRCTKVLKYQVCIQRRYVNLENNFVKSDLCKNHLNWQATKLVKFPKKINLL